MRSCLCIQISLIGAFCSQGYQEALNKNKNYIFICTISFIFVVGILIIDSLNDVYVNVLNELDIVLPCVAEAFKDCFKRNPCANSSNRYK